jgi:hypothetical protein
MGKRRSEGGGRLKMGDGRWCFGVSVLRCFGWKGMVLRTRRVRAITSRDQSKPVRRQVGFASWKKRVGR